jgi:hypothetical protein
MEVEMKKKNDKAGEAVDAQIVVTVELKDPFHIGKRKVSFLVVTATGISGIVMGIDELHIETDDDCLSEHIPRENVVKRKVRRYMIPPLADMEWGTYTYEPYTYPDNVGGYLGSYSDLKGECIAFVDTDLQITLLKRGEL